MLNKAVMKVFLSCVLLLGVLQVNGAPLSSEQKEKLLRYHKDCIRQTNVNKFLIDQARKGTYTDDPSLKAFLFCFSQRIGFQDSSGVIQKEVFEKKAGSVIEDPVVRSKLLEQCTVQKESPEDTSFNIAKCIQEVAPDLVYFKIAPEIIYLTNEQTQRFLTQHKECAAKVNKSEDIIENAIKKGLLYEDSIFKDYIFCASQKQGFINEDGIVNKDKFYKCFEALIEDRSQIDKLAEKCIVQQDTPENTAFFVSQCVYSNSPVHADHFPREITLPEEMAKTFLEIGRVCIKETGVNTNLVSKTKDGVYSDDPKLKEFLFCTYKKAGIFDVSDNFQVDVLRLKTMAIFKDPVLVQKLIDQCVVTQSTPQETAFHNKICMQKNAPGRLNVTQFRVLFETQQEKRKHDLKACFEETGVSESTVLSARKGDFQDDPLLKQYFFCLYKKCGAVNEEGQFHQDFIKKGLTEMLNLEEAERIMEKCFKTQDTPLNTTFESFKCFYNDNPAEAAKVF